MKAFGEKLRELRERAGLSQGELAKASGVPVWTLRKFEQGRREPLWLLLFHLADALDVPVDEFRECTANNSRPARAKAKSRPDLALADGRPRRKKRRPTKPNAPSPSYKASPLTKSKLGTFTSRCRIVCERCAAVLGHVDSTFRHTGMSPQKVISRWPEMHDAVQRHEGDCRPEKGQGNPS